MICCQITYLCLLLGNDCRRIFRYELSARVVNEDRNFRADDLLYPSAFAIKMISGIGRRRLVGCAKELFLMALCVVAESLPCRILY